MYLVKRKFHFFFVSLQKTRSSANATARGADISKKNGRSISTASVPDAVVSLIVGLSFRVEIAAPKNEAGKHTSVYSLLASVQVAGV